jgi:hypothetical protein
MEIGRVGQDIEAWVPFGEDGEVLLAYIPATKLNALVKETTKREIFKGKIVETENPIKANRKLGELAVRGWKNLTSGGEPFEFTPENVQLLMDESYEFSEFVNENCIKIQEFVEAENEEGKKPSESSPGGS